MRFAVFFSFGLGANVAIASVCKPRSRTLSDSSTASTDVVFASSTTSASISTTSADIDTTTTTSVELSISASSTTDHETTTATTATETATTAISTTTAATTTTAASATSAETTTTSLTTTTEDVFVPIPTFDLKALGSDVNGQFVRGDAVRYPTIGWASTDSPVLTFSIETGTTWAREIGGSYLCIGWGDGRYPSSLMLCEPDSLHAGITPITCEQSRDRKLKCLAPGGQCIMNENTGDDDCSGLPGNLDKFYMYRGPMINTPFVAMASSGNPLTSSDYQAVELQLVAHGE
ncbi:hypothetical protein F53441_1266 [Fusarium austroafricanum]|uniref:Uncharacterized protein n=1 Tax=Fusarium austroafricanum TaxID=2364996 RepID=A0A8H4KV55_9HYPO|nr:hypothetical protein F53441_1266 [Fusarium austroafricanum]